MKRSGPKPAGPVFSLGSLAPTVPLLPSGPALPGGGVGGGAGLGGSFGSGCGRFGSGSGSRGSNQSPEFLLKYPSASPHSFSGSSPPLNAQYSASATPRSIARLGGRTGRPWF